MKTKKYSFVGYYVLFFFFFFASLSAQNIKTWDRTFGGSGMDIFRSLLPLPDGGFLIGSSSSSSISGEKTSAGKGGDDYWLVRVDNQGNKVWDKTFGGSLNDNLLKLVPTTDGGFLVGGHSASDISGDKTTSSRGSTDYWIIKIDSQGNKLWDKSYGGLQNDLLSSITPMADGFLLAGVSGSSISGEKTTANKGGDDFWIVKIDNQGNKIWDKTFGGNDTEYLHEVLPTSDGNFLLAGDSFSSKSGDVTLGTRGANDFWIVKIDNQGNKIWDKTFGSTGNDALRATIAISGGEFLLAGGSNGLRSGEKTQDNKGGYDCWVLKIDSQGNKVWDKTFGGSSNDGIYTLGMFSDHTFLMAGASYSSPSADKTDNVKGQYDCWLLKISAAGTKIWDKTIGGTGFDDIRGISIKPDGSFVLAGDSDSNKSEDKSSDSRGLRDLWLIKFSPPTHFVSGQIFQGTNADCKQDSGEKGISDLVVVAEPGNYYGMSDAKGNYTIGLPTAGTYTIRQVIDTEKGKLIEQLCPSQKGVQSVQVMTIGDTVKNINFANRVTLCQNLTISVASDRRRRCFRNNTVIQYANTGYATAPNAKVYLKMPPQVRLISSNNAYTLSRDSVYVFSVGDLTPGKRGTITIIDSVICVNAVRNLTVCTKAWITPANACFPPKTTWDQSDIALAAKCIENGRVRLTIRNSGKNMTDSSSFRIYLDAQLAFQRKFKLIEGDSLIIRVPANGKTVRLEADQRPDHPHKSQTSVTLEGCRATVTEVISTGFTSQFPQDDAEQEVAIDCQMIRDSYDPNDKQVLPTGTTVEHYTPTKAMLDYTLRFQNTGNDVAYTVIVVDTLSENLDISTLQIGSSSHAYTFSINGSGQPVLKWTFSNINLPDSTTNKTGSNGFIRFSIKPKDGMAAKTRIENTAYIYFDYNDPIRTNTTVNVMYDVPLVANPTVALGKEIMLIKPMITSFSPDKGTDGIQVTISGNYFEPGSTVAFGALSAKVISATTTQLVVEVPKGVGSSYISVTNGAGTTLSDKQFSLDQSPLANEPMLASEVKIYPVPLETTLNIELVNTTIRVQKIELCSMVGAVLHTYTWTKPASGIMTIDAKALASGVYLLNFQTTKGNFVKKILIK